MKVLVTGGNGQLGRALQPLFPDGIFVDYEELDITDADAVERFDHEGLDAIINAAAYTNVDGAELPENQKVVKAVNVTGVANLMHVAQDHDIPFVHVSTDYVFDGTKDSPYTEQDKPNPQSVYGATKLESEVITQKTPKHYLLRTSWVMGEGHNFINIMVDLAKKGVNPSVVHDSIGRPTFAVVLANAIKYLLDSEAVYGIYNVTNEGEPVSWADLTREIFKEIGYKGTVTNTTNEAYYKDKENTATRPKNSVLNLAKIEDAGFTPPDWRDDLREYLKGEHL